MISIILIFLTHWLSDFICQTHEMSIKKSKSLLWLSYHVLVYSTVTTLCWMAFFGRDFDSFNTTTLLILSITFLTHWFTDYFTSRWTSKLWEKKDVHNFFVVIGFDQLIHATTLLITYNYLIQTI
mgnify:CR=1 FL=1